MARVVKKRRREGFDGADLRLVETPLSADKRLIARVIIARFLFLSERFENAIDGESNRLFALLGDMIFGRFENETLFALESVGILAEFLLKGFCSSLVSSMRSSIDVEWNKRRERGYLSASI